MRAEGGDLGDVKTLEGNVQFGISDNGIVQEGRHLRIGELRKNCYGSSGLQLSCPLSEVNQMDSSRIRYAN